MGGHPRPQRNAATARAAPTRPPATCTLLAGEAGLLVAAAAADDATTDAADPAAETAVLLATAELTFEATDDRAEETEAALVLETAAADDFRTRGEEVKLSAVFFSSSV